MSARLSDWLTVRLGRNGGIAALLFALAAVLLVARFTSAVYAQTPFGFRDYRQGVQNTCQQVADIAAHRQATHISLDPNNSTNVDQMFVYDRAELQTVTREANEATLQALESFLARPVPLLLREQHDQVAALMPNITALNALEDRVLASLPAKVSAAKLQDATLQIKPDDEALTLSLTTALSSLAGQPCSFTGPAK